MASFRWNHSNEVFVPEIDREHQALYRMAEEARLAMKSASDSAQVTAGIRALLSETEDHFSHEERLMADSRFWGSDWHKRQHQTARKHLRNAIRAQEKGDQAKAERELKSLVSWLNDHTSIADRILGSYLRNHERSEESEPKSYGATPTPRQRPQ